ncbi:MAG: hypothetical protein MJZ81_12160, partial [Bacteroidales bacterium]|nr:hypothetical protein [Bacteroidales bacterium]
MKRKYEFTGETKDCDGVVLRRVRAVRNFGLFKKGDLGGWIESEKNLSHSGNAWLFGDAQVYGNAEVY